MQRRRLSSSSTTLAAGALVLLGCASEPDAAETEGPPTLEAEAPQPEPEASVEQVEGIRVARAGGATAPPPVERRRAAAEQGPRVLINARDLTLREVLEQVEGQTGARIRWEGDERRLSLRLVRAMPLSEAIDLICQFTDTHLTRDYQGRLWLKDGWGGDLGDGTLDPDQVGYGNVAGAEAPSRGSRVTLSSGANTSRVRGGGTRNDAGAGAARADTASTVDRLRRGTTTTQAGR